MLVVGTFLEQRCLQGGRLRGVAAEPLAVVLHGVPLARRLAVDLNFSVSPSRPAFHTFTECSAAMHELPALAHAVPERVELTVEVSQITPRERGELAVVSQGTPQDRVYAAPVVDHIESPALHATPAPTDERGAVLFSQRASLFFVCHRNKWHLQMKEERKVSSHTSVAGEFSMLLAQFHSVGISCRHTITSVLVAWLLYICCLFVSVPLSELVAVSASVLSLSESVCGPSESALRCHKPESHATNALSRKTLCVVFCYSVASRFFFFISELCTKESHNSISYRNRSKHIAKPNKHRTF